MVTSFEQFSIDPHWVRKLNEHHIHTPTPIQSKVIPAALTGEDIIAQSHTGSGKTLAYLLPILNRIDPNDKLAQAVVIVPTRELGMQIAKVAEQLTAGATGADDTSSTITPVPLIGGASIARQVERLRHAHQLVIGTPGRLLELIRMKKLKMHKVRTIVVDEADQVLAAGSKRETEAVVKSALRDRQLIFVSATISKSVLEIAKQWMNDPKQITAAPAEQGNELVKHLSFTCARREKVDMLRRLLRLYEPASTIVFVNDGKEIEELEAKLQHLGFEAAALSGDFESQERAVILNRFREGKLPILLSTDVASRGLDIEDLTAVINYDLPQDVDRYLHRAGRTGRMGKEGLVLTLSTPYQQQELLRISRAAGVRITETAMYQGQLVDPSALPKSRVRTKSEGGPLQKQRRVQRAPQQKSKGAPNKRLKQK